MHDIWEPWVPEVGQRVRIRLSGECRGQTIRTGVLVSHLPQMDGRTAVVKVAHPAHLILPGCGWREIGAHRFLVETEEKIELVPGRPPYIATVAYCAAELEPAP